MDVPKKDILKFLALYFIGPNFLGPRLRGNHFLDEKGEYAYCLAMQNSRSKEKARGQLSPPPASMLKEVLEFEYFYI